MTVKVGTLSADLELDSNPFERNLDRAMDRGGQRAKQIGDRMTAGVTLPLIAAGGAAVKMGVDFDTSMSRIVGLVGVSADKVDELRSGVLDLAGDTAKSPQELADALFTVTSAGFRGAEAMDVLEQAAKASAAGLGETRTIAEALTGAVNAYGPEVLDAARATDILVATARAGNFETSQLAGSLGKVTPFAKQAGASLEDVGGATALLTRVNNNASESITQITALMRAFVVPTAEAQDILAGLDMTAQDVRDSIGERGLVPTLQMLDRQLGGNREQLGRLIGSSEGASAAFQILEADAKTLEETFGMVEDSAGITEEAFLAWAGTSGAELGKALADLQVALIEVGAVIAPIVATVAGGASTMAEAFSALPGPVQNTIIAMGTLLAAVGPVMSIGGRLVQSWAKVSSAMETAGIAALYARDNLAKVVGTGGALAAAAVTVGIAIKRFGDEMREAGDDAEEFVNRFTRASMEPVDSLEGLHDEIMRVGSAAAEMKRRGDEALNPFLKERFREAEAGLVGTRDALLEAEAAAAQLQSELDITADEAARMATNEDVMAAATNEATGEIDSQAAATAQLTEEVKNFSDTLHGMFDPLFAAQDALLKNADAQQKVKASEMELAAAQQELNRAIAEHGEGSEEATEATFDLLSAQERLDSANRDAARSALDVSTATHELARKIQETDYSLGDAERQMRRWVDQGLITEQQARDMATELRNVAARALELEGTDIMIPVDADTGKFDAEMARIMNFSGTVRVGVERVQVVDGEVRGLHTGGFMQAGNEYLTGERGPELIRMTAGGAVVTPAAQTSSILEQRAADGGGGRGRTAPLFGSVTMQMLPEEDPIARLMHEAHMTQLKDMG